MFFKELYVYVNSGFVDLKKAEPCRMGTFADNAKRFLSVAGLVAGLTLTSSDSRVQPLNHAEPKTAIGVQRSFILERERALAFYDNLIKMLDNDPDGAAQLIRQSSSFRVTLSGEVFQQLRNAFSTERETAFLLFANPETYVISRAVEGHCVCRRHRYRYDWEFMKTTVAEMRMNGLRFVGGYHSHTGPTSRASEFPDYDHSLPSPDDVMMPVVIAGLSLRTQEEDPAYKGIASNNRIMLLGAVHNDRFTIRAFAPLNPFGVLGSAIHENTALPHVTAGRVITEKVVENFYPVLSRPDVRASLVRHYRREMDLVEFGLDLEQ
jgi:hypothetical protein